MKKIVLTGLLAVGTMLFGADYQPFVGVEYGKVKATGDLTSFAKLLGITMPEDREDMYGVRVGIEDDKSRVYLAYDYVDLDSEAGVNEASQMLVLYTEGKTRPYHYADWFGISFFLGGHIGLGNYQYEVKAAGLDDDTTELVYGAQAGVLIGLPAQFNLEAGYRHSFSETEVDIVKLNRIKSFYAAVNYKF